MASWQDQIKNHPVHAGLHALENSLKQAREAEITKSDPDTGSAVERSLTVIRFAKRRLADANPAMVSAQLLDNMQQQVNQAKPHVDNFVNNNNAGLIKNNIRQHIDAIAQQCATIPIRLTKKGVEEFAQAVRDYRHHVDEFIRHLTGERSTADQHLSDLQGQTSQAQAELQELTNRIDAKTQEISALTTAQQDEFSKSQDARAEDFETKVNELFATFREEAEGILSGLRTDKSKAAQIVGIIGNTGLTGNYQKIANQEGRTADWLRWGALLCMGGMVALAVWMILRWFPNGVPPEAFLFRLVGIAVLAIPAGYFAFESARHRRVETRMRRVELELTALEPFLRELDTEKSAQLREDLAKKYFGRGAEEREVDRVSPTNLADLLKYAIDGVVKASKR